MLIYFSRVVLNLVVEHEVHDVLQFYRIHVIIKILMYIFFDQ